MNASRRATPWQPGTAPGTLSARHERRVEDVSVRVLQYNQESWHEQKIERLEQLDELQAQGVVTWIDVVGLHDTELLSDLGQRLDLHHLALEDVLNTRQRPKCDLYDHSVYIVLRMLSLVPPSDDEEEGDGLLPAANLESEQVSVFVGSNWVLTIQEIEDDVFDPIRARVAQSTSRLRKRGSDYLAYALLDAVIDESFPILEFYDQRIEALEALVFDNPERELVVEIQQVRSRLFELRRATWPLREVITTLRREDNELISSETDRYLGDSMDHVFQIVDQVDAHRDMASSLMDLYLSSVSNRMNEVMKLLTVVASIFIPLTFLTGLYGMNFDREVSRFNMPELGWGYGYPALWVLMLTITVLMLIFFRIKKYL